MQRLLRRNSIWLQWGVAFAELGFGVACKQILVLHLNYRNKLASCLLPGGYNFLLKAPVISLVSPLHITPPPPIY